MKPELDKAKKKIGAAVLSVTIAAGAAGVTDADDVLPNSEEELSVAPAYVIEEVVDMPPLPDDVSPEDEAEEEKRTKVSAGSVLSYLSGAMLSLLTFLLNTPLSPLATKIVGWAILIAGAFCAVGFGVKKVFPNMPLSKVFSWKTVTILIVSILVLVIGCEIIGTYHEEILLGLRIAVCVLGAGVVLFLIRKIRKAFRKKPKAAEPA